jgi:4a-hydroxytetrahydrobiopterin dehydratase
MALPRRWSDEEIEDALAGLSGWFRREDFLVRGYVFADFDAAMEFIGAVAEIARGLDHHPNLANVYNRVELALQTHDAGGITERDVEFARRVDALDAPSE